MAPKHPHTDRLPGLAAAMNCEGASPPPRSAVRRPPQAFRRNLLQDLQRR